MINILCATLRDVSFPSENITKKKIAATEIKAERTFEPRGN